jgi:hypothetical protein
MACAAVEAVMARLELDPAARTSRLPMPLAAIGIGLLMVWSLGDTIQRITSGDGTGAGGWVRFASDLCCLGYFVVLAVQVFARTPKLDVVLLILGFGWLAGEALNTGGLGGLAWRVGVVAAIIVVGVLANRFLGKRIGARLGRADVEEEAP